MIPTATPTRGIAKPNVQKQIHNNVKWLNGKYMYKDDDVDIQSFWALFQPSILGATVPRDNLLNFKDVIPGGRYSSNSGSTDSLITASAAWEGTIQET